MTRSAPACALGHRREGAVKRVGTARLDEVQLDAQPLGRHLRPRHREGGGGIGGIPEDGHAGDGGEHGLEELQLFPEEFGLQGGQSGDVAPGPGEAGDEADPHRIAHAGHDNGDRRGRVPGGQRRGRNRRQQDVHRETDQLGRESREPFVLSFRRAVLHDEVLAFDIAERAHPLQERLQRWLLRSGRTQQITDPVHVRGRLRLGRERRHEEAEGKGDEKRATGAVHGGSSDTMVGASVGGWAARVNRHIIGVILAATTWSASVHTGVKDVGSSSLLVRRGRRQRVSGIIDDDVL